MKATEDNKSRRILIIYDRLRKGYVLKKKDLAGEFEINERTIQRDLDEIRNYLWDTFENENIIYDYSSKGYILETLQNKNISAVEIFTFIKILIESRAFCSEEMHSIIDSILLLASKSEKKVINNLVRNELFHFQSLTHNKPILKILWDISQHILRKEIVEIYFTKMNGEEGNRIIYPLAIVFSEFYFYLVAKIEEFKHKEPAFFRVDRIIRISSLNRTFNEERFEDGEFKKRILFMYGGKLINLKFLYKGNSIEAVQDKFPVCEICKQASGEYLINAEVYGEGCIMWILSQGEKIEVLAPIDLREKIRDKIKQMNNIYNSK